MKRRYVSNLSIALATAQASANGASTATTKPSNPKESFGDMKLAISLVPDTAIHEETLAFLEGALKYGQYNWRIAGVKVSTYVRAMRRHLNKYWNGQDRDPLTKVKELASIRACCGILIDAEVCGMLNDDRPPRAPVEKHLEELAEVAKHLKVLFKDHTPPQYTQREHGRHTGTLPALAAPYGVNDVANIMMGGGTARIVPVGTLPGPGETLKVSFHKHITTKKMLEDVKRTVDSTLKRVTAKLAKRNPTSRKRLDEIVGTRTTPPKGKKR